MNTRKLQNGDIVPELEKPVELKVYTKCPQKYILIDCETGQKYIGHADPNAGPSNWKKVENA